MTNQSKAVNPVQKWLLTSLLTVKAFIGGCILAFSDAITLMKSFGHYVFGKLSGVKESPMVTQWQGIPSVLNIPAKENLDFNFWRKPTYIVPTLKGMVQNKVKWLLEEKRVEVIPDETLIKWITHGPVSRLARINEQTVSVDLSVLETVKTDDDVFLKGPCLSWTLGDPASLRITYTNGESYTPADGAHWSLSKLHVQAAITLLVPGRFHGNIHFGLPCTAAASLSRLNKKGVLFQLLNPHLRFTLRINNEALRVRRAQDRSKAYAPFAVDGDEFVKSIAGDVQEQTLEPGLRTPPWSLQTNDFPFNQFGQRYFEDVLAFVISVMPKIDELELQAWQQFMGTYIPNFSDQSPADAIATIIWQVTFLHSTDHYTYDSLLEANRYAFNKIHLSTPKESGVLRDISDQQLVDMACHPEDRFRTNVFASTFVRGHKHPLWSNTMDQIRYKFDDAELQQAAEGFQKQLKKTESKLEADGLNLCPLKHVFQSICW